MQDSDIAEKTEALAKLMEKHLGVKAKTFEAALRKAGRQLPKRLRARGRLLVEAQEMAAHPKRARQIDEGAVAAAYRDFKAHLTAIDLAEKRKTRAINIAAGVALNLLLLGVAILVLLRWRGYL